MVDKNISISEYHGLAKNSLWVMFSNISMLFVLALTIFASRLLGDSVFGQYVYLLAVTTILSELCVLGTTDYASILIAQEAEKTSLIMANTLGMRIPSGILYIALCLSVTWFSMPDILIAAFLIALDWVVRSVVHLFHGVFRARNQFQLDAIVTIQERVSVLVCALIGLYFERNLVYFAFGILVGRAIGMAICIVAFCRFGERFSIGFNIDLWRDIIRNSIPIGIRGLLKGGSFRIDALMLGVLRTNAEVGWYGAVYKFLEAGFFFTEAVGGAVRPVIAKAYSQGEKNIISDYFGRCYKLLLVVGSIIVGIVFIYADQIIALVYGPEYMNSVSTLKVLIFAMLMVFGSMISVTVFDAIGLQHKTVWCFIVSLLINILLNFILIPKFGIIGAAWSTLITECFLTIVLLRIALKAGYRFPFVWFYGPLVACASFLSISVLIKGFSTLLGVGLGFIAFTLVLKALSVLDEVDIGYAKMVFQGK